LPPDAIFYVKARKTGSTTLLNILWRYARRQGTVLCYREEGVLGVDMHLQKNCEPLGRNPQGPTREWQARIRARLQTQGQPTALPALPFDKMDVPSVPVTTYLGVKRGFSVTMVRDPHARVLSHYIQCLPQGKYRGGSNVHCRHMAAKGLDTFLGHSYANNMQFNLAEAKNMPGNIAAAHAQFDLVIPLW